MREKRNKHEKTRLGGRCRLCERTSWMAVRGGKEGQQRATRHATAGAESESASHRGGRRDIRRRRGSGVTNPFVRGRGGVWHRRRIRVLLGGRLGTAMSSNRCDDGFHYPPDRMYGTFDRESHGTRWKPNGTTVRVR